MILQGTKRTLLYGRQPLILPRVGPFVSSPRILVSSLPDLDVSANVDFIGSKISAPLKYNHITIASTKLLFAAQMSNIIWANIITGANITSHIGVAGYGNGNGTDGADGGSGGGCAASFTEGDFGGNGGTEGQDGASNVFSGGAGFGQVWNEGTFAWGNGGNGGAGGQGTQTDGGDGGGGDGIGNAGGGGGGGSGAAEDSNGGAGGGPIIGVVCNQLLGAGGFMANGGDAYSVFSSTAGMAGPGGGGVTWVAAKKYSGLWQTYNFAGVPGENEAGPGTSSGAGTDGQFRIYEITRSNALVLRNFGQSWDNT